MIDKICPMHFVQHHYGLNKVGSNNDKLKQFISILKRGENLMYLILEIHVCYYVCY